MVAGTIRRLLLVTTAILGAGFLIFFIQRYQVARMNQSVLSRAADAERTGDLDMASRLYQEHLEMVPADQDAKAKLADILARADKPPSQRSRAAALYAEILARDPGKRDVRRRLAELQVELARYRDAEQHLAILAGENRDDGDLHFLLGRCQEELGNFKQASISYDQAINNHVGSPRLLEAYQRRAFLLRGRLNDTEAAEKAIKAMIEAQPENPQVYLASGRYHRRFDGDLKQAKADFDRALELEKTSAAPSPGIYLELAAVAQGSGNIEEARRHLEMGLKVLPKEASLHEALAMLEARAGSAEKAVSILQRALELVPDSSNLHWTLANLLAERGETASLAVQIDELKRLNFAAPLIEFLEAYSQLNAKDWAKSRQTLIKLRPTFDQIPELKFRLYNLLGRCYGHLGQSELQREAYTQAVNANPKYIPAQLALAANLAERGEIDQAIEIYRKLSSQVPAVRIPFARLLIVRNQRRPAGERDWTEAEELIKKVATDSAGESSEPLLLQTDLLLAQGKDREARELLDQERIRRPSVIDVWIKSAEILRRQREFAKAKSILDQAETLINQELGAAREPSANAASAESARAKLANLQVERARLLIAERSPDLSNALRRLAENAGTLPQAPRRRLLETLAAESGSLNDLELTRYLWTEVARLDPRELAPQINLLDLAFLSKDPNEDTIKAIDTQLARIREIDGVNGIVTRFQECRYLIWQSEQAKENREKRDALRMTAQGVLNELYSRSSWSMIPLALARLAEQDLADLEKEDKEPSASKATRERKKREAANYYLQAVQGGQRSLGVIKRAYDLFYELGDEDKQSQLWNLLPGTDSLRSSLDLQASQTAIGQKEEEKAMELAQRALKDNPKDLRARLWLANLQLANQQREQAEQTLREGDPLHSNPDLQIVLVRFLAMTRQMEKAEKAIDEAMGNLKGQLPRGLLALARCSEMIGQTYKAISQDDQKVKIWTDKASQWYKLAEQARPGDFEVTRQFVDFQIRTGQNADVEKYLGDIIANKSSTPRTQDQVAWARRALALALLMSRDYEQARKALDLVKPIEQSLNATEPEQKESARPEDLRILARVYEAQGTQEYHARARKVIEDLVLNGGAGNAEDRLLLAGIYSKNGEWAKAQGQYEQVVRDTENSNNSELLARRPEYLAQYADELLKQYRKSKDSALVDSAQSIVARLKQLRPNSLSVGTLEARIYAAQDQPAKATELLGKLADDPKVPDAVRLAIAKEAEALNLLDLAERLVRQTFARDEAPQNRLALASFLARRGRVKEGLDLCEPLWKKDVASDAILPQLLDMVFSSTGKNDQVQVDRLAGWIERALSQKPKSSSLTMALANLRERQGKFQQAEALYRQEIEQGGGNIIALNNLAWLMALRNDKSGIALNLINQAIARKGPVPELLDTRGVVYMMSGDVEKAVQDLSRASELDPSGPKFFHLAQAYLQASNRQNASQALAKAHASGLKREDLHPLEGTTYQKILNDLGVR